MLAFLALGCLVVYGQAVNDCSKALHVVSKQFVENGVFVRSDGLEGPPFQPGNPQNSPYPMEVLQASSAPVVYPAREGCSDLLAPGVRVQFVFKPHAVKLSNIACSYAFDGKTVVRVGNRRNNRCIARTSSTTGYSPQFLPDLNSLQPPIFVLHRALHSRASALSRVDLVTGKVYSNTLLPDPGEVDLNNFTWGVNFEAVVNPTNRHAMTFSQHDILALAVIHSGKRGTVPPSITPERVRECARRGITKPSTVWVTQLNPDKIPILEFSNVALVREFKGYAPFVGRYLLHKRRYTKPSTYFSCFHHDNHDSHDEGYGNHHKSSNDQHASSHKSSNDEGYGDHYELQL